MASKRRDVGTEHTRPWEAPSQAVDKIPITPIKNGWAAFGDGWAVHGATQQEALARYWERVAKYQEIAAHPRPIPVEGDEPE
jgi:hypothetical protein